MTGQCPECEGHVDASDLIVHQIKPCPDCGLELELIQEDPPVFAPAPKIEDDWGE